MHQQKLLSPAEFAEAIGVSESSIRRLADSGELRIFKTKGGHRKIPLDEAIRYTRDQSLTFVRPELLGVSLPEPVETAESQLSQALKTGDGELTLRLLQSLYLNGMSVAEICDGALTEAMQKVGEGWPTDRRSIFIEHRATVICMRALNQLRLSIMQPNIPKFKALGASPTGDPFFLPGIMASLVLYEAGYQDINLGPDTPIDVIIDAVEDEQPRIIWLALATPLRSRFQLTEMERLSAKAMEQNCHFVLGGRHADTFDLKNATRFETMKELLAFSQQALTEDN